MKKLRGTTDKNDADILYPKVCSMLDKLAKKNVIHKNKAGNLKSKLAKHVRALAQFYKADFLLNKLSAGLVQSGIYVFGLFVYRLGRKILILERGVRFPYGLRDQLRIKNYEL